MSKYNVDELGWVQFERLVQALLKAAVSPRVESWGGRGDYGADAYHAQDLPAARWPVPLAGPVVFQAKFVAGANAAGAKIRKPVLTAVAAELVRIAERVARRQWLDPKTYVLVTNAPISVDLRRAVQETLAAGLGEVEVLVWGATDIDDLLADNPSIRTAFPQVLGLRDLRQLVREAAGADVLERSRLAIDLTEELAKVFVPTRAYTLALGKLRRDGLVIFTGPPEMGKTATARMIALSRVLDGWSAFECRSPSDFFRFHDAAQRQVFIADDAFGQTEFRADIAGDWAKDMELVAAAADKNHWLMFTSRPGPLNEALRKLEFRSGSTFPKPNEVQVAVQHIEKLDRAVMLYRHAKAAGLGAEARRFIRLRGAEVVNSENFTPYRMHRLVRDELPAIMALPPQERGDALSAAVGRGIRQPTRQMEVSFNNLDDPHRQALIALLDTDGGSASRAAVDLTLRRHLPEHDADSAFDCLRDLDEHFVSIRDGGAHGG